MVKKAPFKGATKSGRWGQKNCLADSPAWGRPAGNLPAIEAGSEGPAREVHEAGRASEVPGLGRQARGWAGWPPEGPGLVPAWGRPGRPVCLLVFFSFFSV